MRADARRNRQRLLEAARAAFVDAGPNAALEGIARRAGVGIATLYRHFPERRSLVRAVAIDVLTRTTSELRAAVAEEPDAFAALRRYLHRAVDAGVGAVMPLVDAEVGNDGEVMHVRNENAILQSALLERAESDGSLRPEVDFGDIGLAVARFSRPIAFGFDPAFESAVGHRHLDAFIDGLHSRCGTGPLPGPALSLDDLRAMREGSHG